MRWLLNLGDLDFLLTHRGTGGVGAEAGEHPLVRVLLDTSLHVAVGRFDAAGVALVAIHAGVALAVALTMMCRVLVMRVYLEVICVRACGGCRARCHLTHLGVVKLLLLLSRTLSCIYVVALVKLVQILLFLKSCLF